MRDSGVSDNEPRRKRRRAGGVGEDGVEEGFEVMRSLIVVQNASDAMALEDSAVAEAQKQQRKESTPPNASPCSICLDLVVDSGRRSIAKLHCGHEFHLDCIGSAFNAKGAMQCPNCRQVEKGRWLYANGHRPPSELDLEAWMHEDMLDLNYPELPIEIRWCPFRGFPPQLASLFEEGEIHQNSYYDFMGSSTFGDPSSASSSSHACPYLAMHDFHPMPVSLTNSDLVPDSARFHRHAANLGAQSSADLINFHSYQVIEPQSRNWQHQQPFSTASNSEQPATQMASRLSRNDGGGGNQQRLGSVAIPHLFLHGSSAQNPSDLLTSSGTPVMGDARIHPHGGHVYQQSVSPVFHGSSHFPLTRRTSGPRAGVPSPPMAATSSTTPDIGVGGGAGRHFDRMYGWSGRENFPPLPWIHVEGESQWWDPFNPTQTPQHGSSSSNDSVTRNFFPQRPTPPPLPPRIPPFQ